MTLDISREIAQARNTKEWNYLASALQKIQDNINGPVAASIKAATSASALVSLAPSGSTGISGGTQPTPPGGSNPTPHQPAPPPQPTPPGGSHPTPHQPANPRPTAPGGSNPTPHTPAGSVPVVATPRTNFKFAKPYYPLQLGVTGSPLIDFSANEHANKSTDNINDGEIFFRMPSPPSISAVSDVSASQSGTGTAINVSSGTYYLGAIELVANSGSFDPGAYGTWYIYFDDPTYQGGAETYNWTADITEVTKAPGRFPVAVITTTSAGGAVGGAISLAAFNAFGIPTNGAGINFSNGALISGNSTLNPDQPSVAIDKTLYIVGPGAGGTGGATLRGDTAATATAGTGALPSAPVGFWQVYFGATLYKIPYYNA